MISASELITVIKESITYVISILSRSEGFEDMPEELTKPASALAPQIKHDILEPEYDEQMEDTDRHYSLRSRKPVNYKV